MIGLKKAESVHDESSESLNINKLIDKENEEKKEMEKIQMIRNSWKFGKHISTLPAWKDVQTLGIDLAKLELEEIDKETKEWVIRELLLTLRCHFCERRRNNTCNFPICVRGLLSGYDIKDTMIVER
jgi:hypothetical protein